MASERTSPLDPNRFGRERKEREKREKGRRGFKEKVSTLSLYFPEIGPSNLGEPRSKVGPHYKSYACVPVLWSFNKLQEVGVFLLLGLVLV